MAKKCPQPDNWCNSCQQTIKTSFLWTIDNFSRLTEKTGEMLNSSTFTAHTDIKTKWYLRLFPNGNKEENKEFVGIFLVLKVSDREEVSTDYKLAIIDKNQRIFKEFGIKSNQMKTFNNNLEFDPRIRAHLRREGRLGLGSVC